MHTPSDYEINAWNELEQARVAGFAAAFIDGIGAAAASGAAQVHDAVSATLDKHPSVRRMVETGRDRAANVKAAAGSAARHTAESISDRVPDKATDFVKKSAVAAAGTAGKVGRAGLSKERVLKAHQKNGAAVAALHELRRLDLSEIDRVDSLAAAWAYTGMATLTGAGTGFVATGGTLAGVTSAGAGAAPTAAMMAGTMAADAAAVYSLSHRAVARTALLYGYDPEQPAEQLFMLAVLNLTSAASQAAKHAAMKDLVKLTRALATSQTWAVINESIVAVVTRRFMGEFTERVTKKGLGKMIPGVGIGIGAALNGYAVDQVVRDARLAYRRRFLLEKYPHLESEDATVSSSDAVVLVRDEMDDADDAFSVMDAAEAEVGRLP